MLTHYLSALQLIDVGQQLKAELEIITARESG